MLEQPTQQLSISCRDEEPGIRMLGRVGDQRLQFLGRFADRVAAKSDPASITDNLAVPFDNCGDLLGDRSIQLERARKAVGFATDLLTPWDIVRSREPYPSPFAAFTGTAFSTVRSGSQTLNPALV